jgi:RNA polymerase sigma factor (sigma-70 family)
VETEQVEMNDDREQSVDELLVMDSQDGDRRAMDALVSRWQKRFWSYACRLTGSPEAAWDVTQESWLGIVRGIRRLNDPARFGPWAYRIVTNKANDWLRRNAGTKRLPADFEAQARSTDELQTAVAATDLHSVLHGLSNSSRAVLTLHYLEGFGLADIANILRVPRGTVKSRLHAARGELKSLWLESPR